MNNFLVVGKPIAHSLSPMIHHMFAEQCGIDFTFEKFLSDEATFQDDVKQFLKNQGRGLNVTVPFKQLAFELADEHTERATLAGVCNTLMRLDDGRILGDNTDGIGLVSDLHRHLKSLIGKSVLILGAGGAVRGILGPLLDSKLKSCCIATRSPQKAESLTQHFPSITIYDYASIREQNFDLIINATSAGLNNELPPLPTRCLSANTTIYDCTYGPKAKPFLDWCREHGAGNCVDGLGMLVEQAAESFMLWHRIRPNTGPVIEQLQRNPS